MITQRHSSKNKFSAVTFKSTNCFIFILILIIISSCTNSDKNNTSQKTAWYKEKISEFKIQFIKSYDYEYRFGEPDKSTKFLSALEEYDRKGNLIRKEFYFKDDDLKKYERKSFFSYDSNGNLTKTIIKNPKDEIESVKKNTIVNDQIVECSVYNSNGNFKNKISYKYDDKGNNLEEITYDSNGKIISKTVNGYNSDSELISTKYYNDEGKLFNFKKYILLDNGKKNELHYDGDNELMFKFIRQYNENDQILHQKFVDLYNKTSTIIENKFDENSLFINTIEYNNNGEPKTTSIAEYTHFPE